MARKCYVPSCHEKAAKPLKRCIYHAVYEREMARWRTKAAKRYREAISYKLEKGRR
jgi:hypothetical protein